MLILLNYHIISGLFFRFHHKQELSIETRDVSSYRNRYVTLKNPSKHNFMKKLAKCYDYPKNSVILQPKSQIWLLFTRFMCIKGTLNQSF